MKNNVTRMLEAKKIPFSVFELSGEKMSAIEVAEMLNIPPKQVYKTIVVKRIGKGKPILALVPSQGSQPEKSSGSHRGKESPAPFGTGSRKNNRIASWRDLSIGTH